MEDRAHDRHYLTTLFGYQGYVVFEAGDALTALELIDRHRPDLVVSGARVPPVGGFEFVRRVRAMPEIADTPVAFYTSGFYEREARAVAELCGVGEVLTRSSTPEIIVDRVHALLARKRTRGVIAAPFAADDAGLRPSSQLIDMVRELAAAEQQMTAVARLCPQLTSEPDAPAMLTAAAEAARAVVHGEYCVVGLFDDTGRDAGPRIAVGPSASMAGRLRGAPLADGARASMLQRVAARWTSDEHAVDFFEALPGFTVTAGLAVPLVSPRPGRPVHGWLAVLNRPGGGAFSDRDEQAASTIGVQAGAAFEHTAARQSLEREAAQLHTTAEHTTFALEAARMGVWTWELPSGYLYGSEALAFLIGLATPDQVRNLDQFLDLVVADDRAQVSEAFARAASELSPLAVECRVARPDGAVRVLQVSGRVSIDGEGRAVRVHGVASDITGRRALEVQLRQAQRIEAIGLLASGVAHDFNNMLTAILGYSRLAEDQLAPGAGPHGEIEQIIKAAERASLLTRQLLSFSRQQVLERTRLDLNATIQDLTAMLRRLIGEQIAVSVTLDPRLSAILADRSQIEQVIVNLVVNARDAMAGGGRLAIATHMTDLGTADVFQGVAAKPGLYATLTIGDSGAGMSDEVRARIFEPFFTTKEHGHGTGLGLATVHGIVRQCGGYVDVQTAVGRGSTFLVYLPALPGPLEQPAHEPAPRAAGGSERVLVIEDEPEVRRLVRTVLERAGYQVSDAMNTDEAEAIIARSAAAIDLLVTDIVMPGGSGPELFARLVKVRPSIRAIFMSGYADDATLAEAAERPGVAFLQKPFTVDGLVRKAREVLDR